MRHLTSEQFVDLAEGVRPVTSSPHLQSCETCREKLAELRATLVAASSMDVPEPSPLFWDHFSARVHAAVEAEGQAATSAVGRWSWLRASPLRVATFAIVVLALVMVIRGGRPGGPAPAPPGPTAAVVPLGDTSSVGDDPSLSLMADLAADLDWDAASEAGLTTHVGVDNDAVANLTDAERRVLDQLLKGELAHRGA
jgi:hypothetical protein